MPQSGEEQGLRQVGIYAVASTEESRLDACCSGNASSSGQASSRRGATEAVGGSLGGFAVRRLTDGRAA
jgi:hypothetical protein